MAQVVGGEEGAKPDTRPESENTIFDSGTTATLIIENGDNTSNESGSSHQRQLLWRQYEENIRALEPRLTRRDIEERIRQLVGQNTALTNQNAALAIQNVALAERAEQSERTARTSASAAAAAFENGEELLSVQIILAFMAGILGWAPPLWFNPKKFLNCDGDNYNHRTVADREDPSTVKEQIIATLKVAFYFVVFVVDLSDAVLDVAVSFQEILNDLDQNLCLWGVWLLLSTIIGRTVGGLFTVFYKRIDESDREVSYLLAELTIYIVEDSASYLFLLVKRHRGMEWTELDKANYNLSLVCGFLFGAPFCFGFKKFARRLPGNASRVIITVGTLTAIWGLFAIFFFNDFALTLSVERFDLVTRLHYCFYFSNLSYIIYHWVGYLIRKDKERRREQQREQVDLEPAVEEEDDSGATTQP